jgi:hypothetical protein
MLFFVIEDFRGRDPKAIYRRFRDKGRLAPEGFNVHHSWIAGDMSRCFMLVEADDVTLLQRWVVEWANLVGFEIVPVAASKDTVAGLASHL